MATLLAPFLAMLAVAAVPSAGADATVETLLRTLGIDVPLGSLSAPPFELPDLQGRSTSLEASRGQVVMLYFWTTY